MYLFEHSDFDTFLQQTETRTKIPVEFVEKDYWVTYVLYRLRKAGVNDFVFKGGTSLTKALNLLERFSEDIDMLFIKDGRSRSQRDKRLEEIRDLVGKFEGVVFDRDGSRGQGSFQTSRYNYDGINPASMKSIQSYVGKELSAINQEGLAEDIPSFEVLVLEPTRTFVEKLFIAHSAFAGEKVTENVRHFYDLYKLLDRAEIQSFLGTAEYLQLKVEIAEASKDFQNTTVPEGLDFARSSAFQKTDELEKTLADALSKSETLFFGEVPTAADLLNRCEQFRTKF
jgi:predicted nucleotidyltransferase component of viral defense system